MKYEAVIETDGYKDFEFFEDGNGKYMIGKDAGATASGGWIPLYFTECKQEPILDKIIAEIQQIELLARYTRGDIKQMVLDIIDKYSKEQEDADSN